jgi:hypothetical protein
MEMIGKQVLALLLSSVFIFNAGSVVRAAGGELGKGSELDQETAAAARTDMVQSNVAESEQKEEVSEEQESKAEERKPHLPKIKEELKEKKT